MLPGHVMQSQFAIIDGWGTEHFVIVIILSNMSRMACHTDSGWGYSGMPLTRAVIWADLILLADLSYLSTPESVSQSCSASGKLVLISISHDTYSVTLLPNNDPTWLSGSGIDLFGDSLQLQPFAVEALHVHVSICYARLQSVAAWHHVAQFPASSTVMSQLGILLSLSWVIW